MTDKMKEHLNALLELLLKNGLFLVEIHEFDDLLGVAEIIVTDGIEMRPAMVIHRGEWQFYPVP
jgi:hypothetical protein